MGEKAEAELEISVASGRWRRPWADGSALGQERRALDYYRTLAAHVMLTGPVLYGTELYCTE